MMAWTSKSRNVLGPTDSSCDLFIPWLEVTNNISKRVTFSPSQKGHELNHGGYVYRFYLRVNRHQLQPRFKGMSSMDQG